LARNCGASHLTITPALHLPPRFPAQAYELSKHVKIELSNAGMRASETVLLSSLMQVSDRLTDLDLSDNQIGADPTLQEGLTALAFTLHKLRSLNLSGNELGRQDSQNGLVCFAKALDGNTTLAVLDISRNELAKSSVKASKKGPPGLNELCRALMVNCGLRSLLMHSNTPSRDVFNTAGFGMQFIFNLTNVFKKNTTLVEISLGCSGMTPDETVFLSRTKPEGMVLNVTDAQYQSELN
jgi:Leucine-rich repeat (LRR) protein